MDPQVSWCEYLVVPVELLLCIIDFLEDDPVALLSCILTCRFLQQTCQYKFYRARRWEIGSVQAFERFVDLIHRSPNTPNFIRRLKLIPQNEGDPLSSWFYSALTQLSPVLVNLEDLWITDLGVRYTLQQSTLPLLSHFKSATTIHLECCTFCLPTDLIRFISSFPDLYELTLLDIAYLRNETPAQLPSVRDMIAGYLVPEALGSLRLSFSLQRLLSHFSWITTWLLFEARIESLESIGIVTGDLLEYESLGELLPRCPNVNTLRVSFNNNLGFARQMTDSLRLDKRPLKYLDINNIPLLTSSIAPILALLDCVDPRSLEKLALRFSSSIVGMGKELEEMDWSTLDEGLHNNYKRLAKIRICLDYPEISHQELYGFQRKFPLLLDAGRAPGVQYPILGSST